MYGIFEKNPVVTPVYENIIEETVEDKIVPIEEETVKESAETEEIVEVLGGPVTPRDGLVPIEIVISPEVSKRLDELGWNDDGAREIAKRARASTVCLIASTAYDSCGGATGFVTQGGLIATCAHCTPHVHNDETGETTDLLTFRIKTITGEILAAKVLEKSDVADLALVQVTSNASTLPPSLPLGRPVKGQPVIMVGHPSLTGYWTMTLGKVELVEFDANRVWANVDISNAAGNSGSPVLNKSGKVIGILSGGGIVENVPDPYPLELSFHPTKTHPTFGSATLGTVESAMLLQDMVNRHQKEWIPETDSKTYNYLERTASPLPKKSTKKSTAERLQELNWSEGDARALAEKVRASTICLRPPSEPTHCISSWVVASDIIATCAHCPHSHGKDGDALVARTISNATLSVELLEESDMADLAIFKVTSNLSALPPPLALGVASIGDPVLMVGHTDLGNWITTLGEVYSIEKGGERYMEDGKWKVDTGVYRADLAWFDGNSGSAVVNRRGEAIGVLTGGAWEDNPPEPYPPHIILDIYKARTDFAIIEPASFLIPMLEKYR